MKQFVSITGFFLLAIALFTLFSFVVAAGTFYAIQWWSDKYVPADRLPSVLISMTIFMALLLPYYKAFERLLELIFKLGRHNRDALAQEVIVFACLVSMLFSINIYARQYLTPDVNYFLVYCRGTDAWIGRIISPNAKTIVILMLWVLLWSKSLKVELATYSKF